jgi:hypothetical protein
MHKLADEINTWAATTGENVRVEVRGDSLRVLKGGE